MPRRNDKRCLTMSFPRSSGSYWRCGFAFSNCSGFSYVSFSFPVFLSIMTNDA